MIRTSVTLLCLLASTAFAQAPEDQAPAAQAAPAAPTEKPRLSVLPFATLDVPARTGAKAAGMLLTEFKGADTFRLVDGKKEVVAEPYGDALDAAKKKRDEGKELRARKKFRLAGEAFVQAIDTFKQSAAGITDVSDLVDTWALLSAVQYNTGRDEEGAHSLSTALAMAPDRELPLAATSQLFSRVVAESRAQVKSGPKGVLRLESSPAGASVLVDGLSIGATPLAVTDVPVGLHVWRVALANGELAGGVVEVPANKQVKLTASASNKDPEAKVLAVLAGNRLDADLVAAAKEEAKSRDADYLVFGALSKDGKGLALDTFLFAAATGEVRRLIRTTFDPELLSAGMEFYNLVGDIAKKGAQAGDAVRLPSAVSTSASLSGAKVAEVKYGVLPGREAGLDGIEPEGPAKEEPRKPLNQRRAPLKKK